MRRCEYKLIDEESAVAPNEQGEWDRGSLEIQLNKLSGKGWEVVHMETDAMQGWDFFTVLLKRERDA